MYLLKLNRKGDIFKDDDGVTGVPEFLGIIKKEKFGPTALKWIALVYDYESPYRHYSEQERKKAELQFDPLDEQLIAFNKKINQFTELIDVMQLNEENAELLQKLMIGVEKILKTRQTLLDAIERRGERQKIAGNKGLSFLERRKEMQSG